METNNSSETVAQNLATSSTGTSGGSAGSSSSTTTATAGTTPASTAVVAPKGIRQDLQQMLQGWQTVVPSGSTMMSSSGSLSQAAVLEQLQAYLGPYLDLDALVTDARKVRAQAASQLTEAQQYLAVLKLAVANSYGSQSPTLVQFGLKPRKTRRVLTSSELAVQAAKAKATRTLRGTIGATKKARIKSGSMKFVEPVPESAPGQAASGTVAGTVVASAAPPNPSVGAASPPTADK
jgi:hypothetical protein